MVQKNKIYTVSEFLAYLNDSLAVEFDMVSVEGEVSEFKISQNKWVWFKLKDESAVMTCFMMLFQLKQQIEDGMRIRATGFPQVFARSGKFAFRPQIIEMVGEGALKKAFELVKKKLDADGLFAPERKRPLPKFPDCIGLITSKDAAAYTDFLRILNNRWSSILVRFYPVSVQGREAVQEIVSAFDYFNQLLKWKSEERVPQVLVLTRGGGSLEDLQAFNDEEVARAIFSSKIPVLCGVGHERDITIADLVADKRASTPSNAAEIVVPDKREVLLQLDQIQQTLSRSLYERVENFYNQIESFVAILNKNFSIKKEKFVSLQNRCIEKMVGFRNYLEYQSQNLDKLTNRLEVSFYRFLEAQKRRLDIINKSIQNLSPQKTLERGYSVTIDTRTGKVVRSFEQVVANQLIDTRLKDGRIRSEVRELKSVLRS